MRSSTVEAIAIIPARYEATRFPGKLLAQDRTGKVLLRYVCEAAESASKISRVIVATDDKRIKEAVEAWGGEAVMTSPDHKCGTDRAAEVSSSLDADIIVNVQGDEPEMRPQMIDQVVDLLVANPDCVISTLACKISHRQEVEDPDTVKVVLGEDGRALYFSRWPIPYVRNPEESGAERGVEEVVHLKHIGIYGYRSGFLATFTSLPQSPLEKLEKLEQLRALHHGYRIAVGITPYNTLGIDTPADFETFLARTSPREDQNQVKEDTP